MAALERALLETEERHHRRRCLSDGRSRRALLACLPLLCVALGAGCLVARSAAVGYQTPDGQRHPRGGYYLQRVPDFAAPASAFRPRYSCATCVDVLAAQRQLAGGERACGVFGACGLINASTRSCDAFCTDGALAEAAGMPRSAEVPRTLNLRVSKGLGSRPYGTLRLSVVTSAGEEPPLLRGRRFDYSGGFRYRWTQYALHSSLVRVAPGAAPTLFDVDGTQVALSLPPSGEGTAGVLIADPCVSYASLRTLVGCAYGVRFRLAARLPELLHAFVGNASDVGYWGVLGDNLYDRTGEVSQAFFDSLSLQTKAKPLLTVPGNHDYYALGTPRTATRWDQFANGFVQWHAQDTLAAAALRPGDHAPPFDFSNDPDEGRLPGQPFGGQKPALANTFWHHSIGNVGFVGFSGAYTYEDTLPHVRQACASLGAQPDVRLLVLLGHWDVDNMGCKLSMDVPAYYERVSALPGCSGFAARGLLKFFMGHTHCNVPHPHGHVDTGFMVAGQGMEGCGNWGLPMLDTTDEMARLWYFPIVLGPTEPIEAGDARYDRLLACATAQGWRACTHLATLWLNQTLPPRASSEPEPVAT